MASVMETFNATSTALPDSVHAVIASAQTGILSKAFDNFSSPVGWFGVFLAVFLAAVIYDQSKSLPPYMYRQPQRRHLRLTPLRSATLQASSVTREYQAPRSFC